MPRKYEEVRGSRVHSRLAEVMSFKGVLASVALSHPADHDCEICRAAGGDEDAFARLFAASQERRK